MSIEFVRIKRLLKDVVILRLHERPTGTITGLHLPSTARVPLGLIPGTVLHVGSKFRYKSEVNVGDVLYVPSHFGNAVNQFDEYVRFFDGEDCHAILCKTQ